MHESRSFRNILHPDEVTLIVIDNPSLHPVLPGIFSNALTHLAESGLALDVPTIMCTMDRENENDQQVDSISAIFREIPLVRISQLNPYSEVLGTDCVPEFKRSNLLLVGAAIEGPVSLIALSALEDGYNVHLIVDGLASSPKFENQIALDRLTQAGAVPITARQVVMDWQASKTKI